MSDFNQLINEEKPTLVDFFATWCGPCRVQGPILEDVKKKMADSVNILKVDIDQNQALAAQYNVRSVPTLILFKNGMAVWRAVGVQQIDTLVDKLTEHIGTKSDEQ
ncbi:MAG: thioredoxin [Muribaculaceae bacterium]|nr:thioredoxin [Muribaculaceae bacterium]